VKSAIDHLNSSATVQSLIFGLLFNLLSSNKSMKSNVREISFNKTNGALNFVRKSQAFTTFTVTNDHDQDSSTVDINCFYRKLEPSKSDSPSSPIMTIETTLNDLNNIPWKMDDFLIKFHSNKFLVPRIIQVHLAQFQKYVLPGIRLEKEIIPNLISFLFGALYSLKHQFNITSELDVENQQISVSSPNFNTFKLIKIVSSHVLENNLSTDDQLIITINLTRTSENNFELHSDAFIFLSPEEHRQFFRYENTKQREKRAIGGGALKCFIVERRSIGLVEKIKQKTFSALDMLKPQVEATKTKADSYGNRLHSFVNQQVGHFLLKSLHMYVFAQQVLLGVRTQTTLTGQPIPVVPQTKFTKAIRRVGHRLMYTQMGIHMLGGMLNANFIQVASSVTFLVGSIGLELLSQVLINFRAVAVTSSIWRYVLGAVGPFVGRVTGFFVVFEISAMLQQLAELEKVPEQHAGMIRAVKTGLKVTKAALAVEVLALGLEIAALYFGGRMALFAAQFVPMLNIVSMMLTLGVQIYLAAESVRQLNNVIELTSEQWMDEFIRQFGATSESYLQRQVKQRQLHEQYANSLIEELERDTSKKFYIMYTHRVHLDRDGTSQLSSPVLNNYIDLNTNVTRYSITHPRLDATSVQLLCSENTIYRDDGSNMVALDICDCKDMLGVGLKMRPNGTCVVDMGEGADIVVGFREKYPNEFFINGGLKQVIGGELGDTFILSGSKPVYGLLDGGPGEDILILDSFMTDVELSITTNSPRVFQIKYEDVSKYVLDVLDIEVLIGRTNETETVQTLCNMRKVDLRGGNSEYSFDAINIPRESCSSMNLVASLHKHTILTNKARKGRFVYNVVPSGGPENARAHVYLDPDTVAVHSFRFENQILDLERVSCGLTSATFLFKPPSEKFTFRVDYYKPNMAFIFQDDAQMTINEGRLTIHIHKDQHDPDVVAKARTLATKFGCYVTVRNGDREQISVGYDEDVSVDGEKTAHMNILENTPLNITCLIGANNNIFRIRADCSQQSSNKLASPCGTFYNVKIDLPIVTSSLIDFDQIATEHTKLGYVFGINVISKPGEKCITINTNRKKANSRQKTKLGTLEVCQAVEINTVDEDKRISGLKFKLNGIYYKISYTQQSNQVQVVPAGLEVAGEDVDLIVITTEMAQTTHKSLLRLVKFCPSDQIKLDHFYGSSLILTDCHEPPVVFWNYFYYGQNQLFDGFIVEYDDKQITVGELFQSIYDPRAEKYAWM